MVACTPFGPAGEFAASRHGALTRSQAATHGLSDAVIHRMVRDAVLYEPVPGVLVVAGSPPTWHQRLYVATLASNRSGVAGFRSAAALQGIDGYQHGPVELLLPSSRKIRLPSLVMHRGMFDASDIISVDSIRCTNIARTLCDIGTVDSLARLNVAFEWAWRQGISLTWLRRTAERLEGSRHVGPRRLLKLLDAAERHQRPTESALEVRVEAAIMSIPGVVRQYRVLRNDGSFVARVDFAIPHLKIAIEAHSRRHHFGVTADERDAEREAELQAEAWIVRFVTDAQRRRPDRLRTSLRQLVLARQRPTA